MSRLDAATLLLLVCAGLCAMMYAGITGELPFHLGEHHESSCPQSPPPKE